jgi:hypothetical protein
MTEAGVAMMSVKLLFLLRLERLERLLRQPKMVAGLHWTPTAGGVAGITSPHQHPSAGS